MEIKFGKRVSIAGMENIVIVDSIWFSLNVYNYLDHGDLNVLGIVKTYDMITKKYKYYIGAASGKDLVKDEQFIVACGSPFNTGTNFAELYTIMKLKGDK